MTNDRPRTENHPEGTRPRTDPQQPSFVVGARYIVPLRRRYIVPLCRQSRFDRIIEGILDQHIVAAVSATEQAHMVGAAIDLPAPQLVVNLAANRRPQTGLAGVIA